MTTKGVIRRSGNGGSGGCGNAASERGKLKTYAAIVQHYRTHGLRHAKWLEKFDADPKRNFDEALESIAFAQLPNGMRHPHQRRLKRVTLKNAHQRLRHCDLERCDSFEELFKVVEKAIAGIFGIAPLMVYDTTRRLGYRLGLHPKLVYLHAGTQAGATALGYPPSAKTIDTGTLPKPLQQLTAGEIEDGLCI